MKPKSWINLSIIVLSFAMTTTALTKTREADVLNLNGIQDGDIPTREKEQVEKDLRKDGAATETQEKRSFIKPDFDKRGSFYPSGPPGGSSPGIGPNYHTSGNGYSYGLPSGPGPGSGSGSGSAPDYPGSTYGSNIPHPGHDGGIAIGGPGGLGGPGGHYPIAPGPHQHVMSLKQLLLPIAGVALLGAAAVLAKSHPVLLQLGVVSGRKRRSINEQYPMNPFVRPQQHFN